MPFLFLLVIISFILLSFILHFVIMVYHIDFCITLSWLIGKDWEGLGAGGEGDDRGWDGWMASLTWWTWVWVESGSWWWAARPGVLRSMGSQGVRHDWETELNLTEWNVSTFRRYRTWWPNISQIIYAWIKDLFQVQVDLKITEYEKFIVVTSNQSMPRTNTFGISHLYCSLASLFLQSSPIFQCLIILSWRSIKSFIRFISIKKHVLIFVTLEQKYTTS